MANQLIDTTGDGVPRLAAIELRYELAKARITRAAVPAESNGTVHDTIAVDVETTKPPLVPVPLPDPTHDRGTHAAEAPQRGRRLWRSLRMSRFAWTGLPTA
ncbi:hypothetical protein [Petropleomorpha daqingensis]|uniref:Uncharacterized protein n=1 Tax=Petropleomorpha daqingensis TaxID=2026353 RepID=A0A853CEW4_9ACTN|nr:hypothetical protein [Petropleomorpha daqingensis]NYJ06390.1 hypothetical protein [Petropleomorpha daqingensis]